MTTCTKTTITEPSETQPTIPGSTEPSKNGNEKKIEDLSKEIAKLSTEETEHQNPTIEELANAISSGKFKNVIVMSGAGISVSAGIPDFRTPGTGLYDNLQGYGLENPQQIFELDFFSKNPKPFVRLAKELYPGEYNPTIGHHFIKLLNDKGILLRCFTQNIDGLDRVAGLPSEKLVEAHGGFNEAHCIKCKKEYSSSFVKEKVFKNEVPTCDCGGYIKPDIVFFGEGLPDRFHKLTEEDFPKCDLLIVMGTSLTVHPFAGLVERVNENCTRVLINREKVGTNQQKLTFTPQGEKLFEQLNLPPMEQLIPVIIKQLSDKIPNLQQCFKVIETGFRFDEDDNTRDIFVQGDCDAGARKICELVGGDWLTLLELSFANYKGQSSKVQHTTTTTTTTTSTTTTTINTTTTTTSTTATNTTSTSIISNTTSTKDIPEGWKDVEGKEVQAAAEAALDQLKTKVNTMLFDISEIAQAQISDRNYKFILRVNGLGGVKSFALQVCHKLDNSYELTSFSNVE